MRARHRGAGRQIEFDASKPDGTPRKLLDVSGCTTSGKHQSASRWHRSAYESFRNNRANVDLSPICAGATL
jgi:hypothetical protein